MKQPRIDREARTPATFCSAHDMNPTTTIPGISAAQKEPSNEAYCEPQDHRSEGAAIDADQLGEDSATRPRNLPLHDQEASPRDTGTKRPKSTARRSRAKTSPTATAMFSLARRPNQQRASEQHEADGQEPTRLEMSPSILSTCLSALAPAPRPSVVLAVTIKVTGARIAVFPFFIIRLPKIEAAQNRT